MDPAGASYFALAVFANDTTAVVSAAASLIVTRWLIHFIGGA